MMTKGQIIELLTILYIIPVLVMLAYIMWAIWRTRKTERVQSSWALKVGAFSMIPFLNLWAASVVLLISFDEVLCDYIVPFFRKLAEKRKN